MSTGKRFTQFLDNIGLTQTQIDSGSGCRDSVVSTLNATYYGNWNKTNNSQYVGSWGKFTRVRPPRDVDVLYTLPFEVYNRYHARSGNKQSQILQEVKNVLARSFPNTNIRGDGPVVLVPFSAFSVELIPCFKLENGQYFICMTTNGGSYKTAAYDAEASAIKTSNDNSSNNTRHCIRMMKRWQAYCSVSLKSFWIEIIATAFVNQWQYRGNSTTYYDYMVRDFLEFLIRKVSSTIYAPGTYEAMSLGSVWEAKAKTALTNAKSACAHEANSAWDLAGIEWQKLFGTDIPRNP